jgi:hypothetical protein
VFLCGATHTDVATEFRVVGIGHLFDEDQTLVELGNLPADWEAERATIGGPWLRTNANADS